MLTIVLMGSFFVWIMYAFSLPTSFEKDRAIKRLAEKSIPFILGTFYMGTAVADKGLSFITYAMKRGDMGEKACVIVAGVGIVWVMLVELLIRRSVGYCIRDLLTLMASFSIGYATMSILNFLERVMPFPLNLLFILVPVVQGIVLVAFVISIPIWFIPTGALAEMNRANDRRERAMQTSHVQTEETDDYGEEQRASFPVSIISPEGETFRLENDSGDNATYYCSRTGTRVHFRDSDFNDGCPPTGWYLA